MDGIILINKEKKYTSHDVALGSNVPVCPTFTFNIFFTFYCLADYS